MDARQIISEVVSGASPEQMLREGTREDPKAIARTFQACQSLLKTVLAKAKEADKALKASPINNDQSFYLGDMTYYVDQLYLNLEDVDTFLSRIIRESLNPETK